MTITDHCQPAPKPLVVLGCNILLTNYISKAGLFPIDIERVVGENCFLPRGVVDQLEATVRAGGRLVILAHHQADPAIPRIVEILKCDRITCYEIAICDLRKVEHLVCDEIRRAVGESATGRPMTYESRLAALEEFKTSIRSAFGGLIRSLKEKGIL